MNMAKTTTRDTQLIITANFTADPIIKPLDYWFAYLNLPVSVKLAPYDQIFQQLLDPNSLSRCNDTGINILLLRLETWLPETGATNQSFTAIIDDFATALRSASEADSTEYLLVFCPGKSEDTSAVSAVAIAEKQLHEVAASCRGIQILTMAEFAASYPVKEIHDENARRLADIPYTPVFFTALGTAIARRVFGLITQPSKVIVLDCDDTLWGGLCGELGPTGVAVDESHLILQRWAKQQQQAGKLLCIASRNNETDVIAVFERHPAMLLKTDDITAMQVHWGLKSDSIATLTDDLGLGLDSFVFIDDDQMQCAEVNRRFPQVLALPLPGDALLVEKFCQHIWPLDLRRATLEGQRRTEAYRDHAKREQLRRESMSLQRFLDELQLDVNIEPLKESTVARASELTYRTNQFNLTGLRQTEAEVASLLHNSHSSAFNVIVRDRFGDYGLVGLIIIEVADNILEVPIFLLSCRALGRGVEHQMLAFIGAQAQARGLDAVAMHCVPSGRNQPAQTFLSTFGEINKRNADTSTIDLTLDSATAASVKYEAEAIATDSTDSSARETDNATKANTIDRVAALSRIPLELTDADQIHRQVIAVGGVADITSTEMIDKPDASDTVADNAIESSFLRAFTEQLGIDDIDRDSGFFDLGGHSLQAVQVLAQVSAEFDVELDPTLLFTTNFSIAELADEIRHLQSSAGEVSGVSSVLDQLSSLTDD